MDELEKILSDALTTIQSATDLKVLDACRVEYLGKKGKLTDYLKTLGQLPVADRPLAGQRINTAKETIQTAILQRDAEFKKNHIEMQLASEAIDITLPGRSIGLGSIHPITKTCIELRKIFMQMGFSFKEGPEIEDDQHNFTSLNIPEFHPARAMQDTFYFGDGSLLRTHMSTVQIRTMKEMSPPLRIAALGRVYRRDFDVTHTPMFHQMECLVIDRKYKKDEKDTHENKNDTHKPLSFADLKGLVHDFLNAFFSPHTIDIRFRPSYFPFTEPSAEVDINCIKCASKGCRICKYSGWLEVLGCGMVHPNVLSGINKSSTENSENSFGDAAYSGFAFGAGIDRLAMLKYGISDLRSLFENDLRFLEQF